MCEGALFERMRANGCNVTALNEQAANNTVRITHRFVGNIQSAPKGLTGRRPVELDGLVSNENRFTRSERLVRRIRESLVI